nr:MAG TPA: hypothetical protein [Caudoviricetes sp.]DAZ33522.1 MAG TPA: hypothetical protein [Caudoviricetes sp.]
MRAVNLPDKPVTVCQALFLKKEKFFRQKKA